MADADGQLEKWMDRETEYRKPLKAFLRPHHAGQVDRGDALTLAGLRAEADKYRDRYFRATLTRR
jgi:hypothetical protein